MPGPSAVVPQNSLPARRTAVPIMITPEFVAIQVMVLPSGVIMKSKCVAVAPVPKVLDSPTGAPFFLLSYPSPLLLILKISSCSVPPAYISGTWGKQGHHF